jgi:hypothetical protein
VEARRVREAAPRRRLISNVIVSGTTHWEHRMLLMTDMLVKITWVLVVLGVLTLVVTLVAVLSS